MRDCIEIPTSTDVFLAIWREHRDNLQCFACYSDTESNAPRVETWFGVKGTEFPIIHALTTWEHGDHEYERINETHKHWLCVARKCECD